MSLLRGNRISARGKELIFGKCIYTSALTHSIENYSGQLFSFNLARQYSRVIAVCRVRYGQRGRQRQRERPACDARAGAQQRRRFSFSGRDLTAGHGGVRWRIIRNTRRAFSGRVVNVINDLYRKRAADTARIPTLARASANRKFAA